MRTIGALIMLLSPAAVFGQSALDQLKDCERGGPNCPLNIVAVAVPAPTSAAKSGLAVGNAASAAAGNLSADIHEPPAPSGDAAPRAHKKGRSGLLKKALLVGGAAYAGFSFGGLFGAVIGVVGALLLPKLIKKFHHERS